MGKQSDYKDSPPSTPSLGESANAISLHTNVTGASASTSSSSSAPPLDRYFDNDPAEFADDDLPPLYSDVDPTHDARKVVPVNPLLPPSHPPLLSQPFHVDCPQETSYYLDRRLHTDPKFLADHISVLAAIPPRPFVHIRGTHQERQRRDGKKERTTVTDFSIDIELTHLLYSDIGNRRSWSSLDTVSHFEKVRRGTVFPKRAPGFGGSGGSDVAEDGVPDLEEWCHRFCASHAGLKNFVFRRHVTGWDFEVIRKRLDGLVRSTNYRGRLDIQFPVRNDRVEILNDCRTNRWRLTSWICMIFYFTLLFIFTWPYLFFRTKRWETVTAEWRLGRTVITDDGQQKQYPVMSEERWYNTWARPIERAILERRQGTLDQGDLARAEEVQPRAEGFAGVVQAGVAAMGVVNRSFGWGGDTA